MTALVVGDAALGPADDVFAEALRYLERRLSAVRPLDVGTLPADRAAAVAALDAWAGADARNWRLELVRWFEAHAPVLLRPDPVLNGHLRRAARAGTRLAVVSPLPDDAAELYLSQLGVRRAVELVVGETASGGDPVETARRTLGAPDAPFVRDRAALEAALAADVRR